MKEAGQKKTKYQCLSLIKKSLMILQFASRLLVSKIRSEKIPDFEPDKAKPSARRGRKVTDLPEVKMAELPKEKPSGGRLVFFFIQCDSFQCWNLPEEQLTEGG